eukprot:1387694-Amorphochlora_amoeboformis.AAC.1
MHVEKEKEKHTQREKETKSAYRKRGGGRGEETGTKVERLREMESEISRVRDGGKDRGQGREICIYGYAGV